jgi:hypothetical protein
MSCRFFLLLLERLPHALNGNDALLDEIVDDRPCRSLGVNVGDDLAAVRRALGDGERQFLLVEQADLALVADRLLFGLLLGLGLDRGGVADLVGGGERKFWPLICASSSASASARPWSLSFFGFFGFGGLLLSEVGLQPLLRQASSRGCPILSKPAFTSRRS